MKIEGKEYRTIWFENNVVKIIDQTKLPHQFIIKDLKTVEDAINAINGYGSKRCTLNRSYSSLWISFSYQLKIKINLF